MNSNGSVYKRKDGLWVAKYHDAEGKWKYIYRKTKAEAKKALRSALNDVEEGITTDTKLTVYDVVDSWLEGLKDSVGQRTWLNRETMVRVHIRPHSIGTKKLVKLAPDHVRGFYREKLQEGLSPATVKRLHDILKASTRGSRTRYNPLGEVSPPKQVQRELDVLKPEQVSKLLDTVKDSRLELVYVLGAVCGLRLGETLALQYQDFDMEHGTIFVRHTVWKGKLYPPKANSKRKLKLPRIALEALQRHGMKEEGYLFPTRFGNPVAASNFRRYFWRPALKKAGLPETLRFHDLRHGTASLLLGQSIPIPVVSKYLGHSNPATTMKIYAHMIDGMGGLAASGMDDALS